MPGPAKKPNGERKSLTVRLPAKTVERLKQVARLAAGHPTFSTVTTIVDAGINREIDRLQAILSAAFKDIGEMGIGSDPTTQSRSSVRLSPLDDHAVDRH